MMLQAGQEFSHFRIEKKLGEGGMGEVYLAEDLKLNRLVALKILQAEFFDSTERLERFTREAKTAAGISHPNVMSIFDIGRATEKNSGKEISYIVMEYIKGSSLTDHLRDRVSNQKELLRIAEKIAAGLAAAHKMGIVHRDIKTDNIKIDENGEPKILDFGLAKPVVSAVTSDEPESTQTVSKELTQEGKILGTVTYMSPEQARGGIIDGRSDIFSFGVMLYKMFSGDFPFDGQDRVSTLAKILEAKQEPLRRKNEAIPAELERIVDKCLQKDPADRYQDTRDLVVDLRSLRRQYDSSISETTSTVADASTYHQKMRVYKISTSKFTFIAIAVVASLLAVYFATNDSENAPASGLLAKENALAILGFENKTGDDSLDWLSSGLPEILLTDLAETGSINLINRNRILDCLDEKDKSGEGLPNYQACVNAARSLGATRVLAGSFYKLGDQIRIDARMEDAKSGKILMGEKVVGKDMTSLVDSLTQKIALSLNVNEMLTEKKGVASITSSSPEAYKYYILGMEKFGLDTEKAIEYFEKAIEIDSTFALPYMRLGMAYAFKSRNQEAAQYFVLANKYADKLPIKERTLLDIYSDIWLRQEFDNAFSKTRSFLTNYPDDKETRGYYALMLNTLKRDPQAALAQLDTVLMIDPNFYPALSWYANIYLGIEEYDKAIEYAIRAKDANPDTPGPMLDLLRMYYRQSRYDDVEKLGKEILERFPDNLAAKNTLIATFEIIHEFDKAREVLDLVRKYHSDDKYAMTSYYSDLANLKFWEGKFHAGMDDRFEALNITLSLGDSSWINGSYTSIAYFYRKLGMLDSALVYSKESYKWATGFDALNHALNLVRIDQSQEAEARRIMKKELRDFRGKLPEELWYIADNLEGLFEGYCKADTNLLIKALQKFIAESDQKSSGDMLELGILLVEKGRFQEGREALEKLLTGEYETPNAFKQLPDAYYLGRACEGLGDIQEAKSYYQTVLKYWGNADIQLKEIVDTKRRLRKLTS